MLTTVALRPPPHQVRLLTPEVAPGPHTDIALARCRFGRREAGAVTNVTHIEAGAVTCGPTPPTELYQIGVDKEVRVALNGEQVGACPPPCMDVASPALRSAPHALSYPLLPTALGSSPPPPPAPPTRRASVTTCNPSSRRSGPRAA